MTDKTSSVALVVEDEVDLRELAIAALEQVGYKVIGFASAEEAIAALEDSMSVSLSFSRTSDLPARLMASRSRRTYASVIPRQRSC